MARHRTNAGRYINTLAASRACQYPFSPSQDLMLAGEHAHSMHRHRTNVRYTDTLHDALNQSRVNVGLMLAHIQRGAKHDTVSQYWANVGSAL